MSYNILRRLSFEDFHTERHVYRASSPWRRQCQLQWFRVSRWDRAPSLPSALHPSRLEGNLCKDRLAVVAIITKRASDLLWVSEIASHLS